MLTVEPAPLDQLGLRLSDHCAALWWLALLYRRPVVFTDSLKQLPRMKQTRVGFLLWLHALPYALVVAAAMRAATLRLSGVPWSWTSFAGDLAVGIAFGIAIGIAAGIGRFTSGIASGVSAVIAFGIAFGIGGGTHWIALGIAVGIVGTIVPPMAYGVPGVIAVGIVFGIGATFNFGTISGIFLGITMGFSFGLGLGRARGIARGFVAAITAVIVSRLPVAIDHGITVSTAIQATSFRMVAFGFASLRLYYQLIHPLFMWPAVRGGWYPWHPVAWDDLCDFPFPGLDRLLVAYAEQKPASGQQEIERLITSYPMHRMAALRARTILLARQASCLTDLSQLSVVAARLPEGQKGFLKQNRQVREGLGEIGSQQLHLNAVDRPMLREPVALNLVHEIESFRSRLAGFEEPLRTEFRAAAERWETSARKQLDDARRMLARQPIRQVFRAGDPVDRESEAFVLRDAVVGQLDQQVTLAGGCPGVVLYARRRMGKSTVLRNLTGLLPQSTLTAVISMQDPRAFTSLERLVARIAQAAAPGAIGGHLPRDLPGLQRHLETCNARLQQENRRLLLALDEYEQIDVKIGEGVFPRDLLSAIRESIQTHRQITWLFAGSHNITELPHAQWTSYLVSARTIEVPPFALPETELLLTEPMKHSQLWKTPEARPHFPPEFWGEGGIERIHREADGWPHLLQLIAETTVDLLNERAAAVTPALLERALDRAVTSGHIVLSQLMQGESSLPGEWDYLAAFRGRDEQPPPEGFGIQRSLLHRQIIREENGLWRLRVPLMARWLRLRG